MTLTPTIERAIRKASLLHNGQTRKAEVDLPYITHLFSVAALLSEYAAKEDVVVAGLLHDTLEDTVYSPAELEEEFGIKVRTTVESVTEATLEEKQKIAFSWKERKLRYLEKLQRGSAEALMVSAADKVHNLQTIIDDFRKHGPDILKNFKTDWESQLWFFGEVLAILEERLESPIVSRFRDVYAEAQKTLLN